MGTSRAEGRAVASLRLGLVVALAWSASAAVGCASRQKNEAPAPSSGESKADKHYDVAVGSFHNGMFEDAKLQLDRALTIDPKHADSYYLKGVLALNEGQTIINAIEYDQCLTDDAAERQRVKAEEFHRQAADSFRKAIEFYPEGAAGRGRAFNSLAVVSLYFHRDAEAVEAAESALAEQFYTDRYSALSNLGWAHYRQGDRVAATAELRQAVLINPDYCVGHYRLAQVYLDGDLVEPALEHALAVMDDERCPIQDAYRIGGVAYLRQGMDDKAAAALEACVNVARRSCLAQDCMRLLGPTAGRESALAHAP